MYNTGILLALTKAVVVVHTYMYMYNSTTIRPVPISGLRNSAHTVRCPRIGTIRTHVRCTYMYVRCTYVHYTAYSEININ